MKIENKSIIIGEEKADICEGFYPSIQVDTSNSLVLLAYRGKDFKLSYKIGLLDENK